MHPALLFPNRRMRMFSSVMLALLLTAGAGLPGFVPLSQSAPDLANSEQVRLFSITELEAGSNGHFETKARINHRSVSVLVDTGASAVALSYEDAESVGLKPRNLDFNVKVSTANGEGTAARVMLTNVEIGGVRVRDVEGLVLQKGAMRGTLLGMSFLGRLKSFSVEDGKLVLKN
jgi:aspartyl protease family protein